MKKLAITLCASMLLSALSYAGMPADQTRNSSQDVMEIPALETTTAMTPSPLMSFFPGTGGVGVIGGIANLGSLAWDIIKDNRANATVATEMATALPRTGADWQNMVGWKTESKVFHYVRPQNKNANAVDFTYRINYSYGSLVGKAGQYLTGITVIPVQFKAAWGYTFNAAAAVPQATIFNVGTADTPLASARIYITWTVKKLRGVEGVTKVYEVQGDGQFQEVNLQQ